MDILKKVAGDLVSNAEKRARENGVDDIVGEVEEGPVARINIARAKHHDADMIVVGSRGFGSIEHRSDSSRWRLASGRPAGGMPDPDGQMRTVRSKEDR